MINTGLYVRIGTENVLLEDLSEKDLADFLNQLTEEGLKRTIALLCSTIKELKENK